MLTRIIVACATTVFVSAALAQSVGHLQTYDAAIRAACPSIDGVDQKGVIFFTPAANAACRSAANAAAASYVPVATRNVVPFAAFIRRWTDAEYALLMQKRAAAVTAGTVALVKQWDSAMADGSVDLNLPAATTFKAALVSNGILTQVRADAIFQ